MIDLDFSIYYMTAMKGWPLAKVNLMDCSSYASRVASYPTFARRQPFIKVGKL